MINTILILIKVLNWFINARNSLKNKMIKKERFSDLITERLEVKYLTKINSITKKAIKIVDI